MNPLRFFRALCTTESLADTAVDTLRRRLHGKTSASILAQAEARLRRRLFQGIPADAAMDAVVAWATSADHARWTQ